MTQRARPILAFRAISATLGLLCLATRGLAGEPADTNYDERKVPTYTLPDPLRLENGERVNDAATWRNRRRPELLRLFAEHVYGLTPPLTNRVTWAQTSLDAQALGGKATRKEVTVYLDGRPEGPRMHVLLYLPNGAPRPVPVFLGLNFYGNACVHPERGIALSTNWMRPTREMGIVDHRATEASRGCHSNLWQVEKVLARGYALATVYYGDIEPDFSEGWRLGVRGRSNPPGTNTLAAPHAWGTIGAWAWGLSRAVDYLESEPAVDAHRVAVVGHSRLGKTALWAAAQDERIALTIANNSGEGGASLARRRYGETIKHLTDAVPYWFCPRYAQYAGHEDDLPVDTHELVALLAPRPAYIASAVLDRWADPLGEFLAARHAEPVYRLFGLTGVGVTEQPALDHPVGEHVGYHIRSGDHAVTAYDWDQYLRFADRHFRHAPTGRQPGGR